MPQNIKYSLQTIPFQFNTFTPQQRQITRFDTGVIERGLAQKAALKKEALQGISGVDAVFSNIEPQMHNSEKGWLNEYKNNTQEELRNNFLNYRYGKVVTDAGLLGGKIATDTAVLGRIEANKKYNEWDNTLKQRLAKKEISQDAYSWAIANNPYQINETFDNDGRTTNVELNQLNQIYDTINWGDVAAKAAAFNRPDVIASHNGGGGTNPVLYQAESADMAKLNGMLGAASSKWENGHQVEEVTSKQIIDTIGTMLDMPDLLNQAIQDYDVSVWNYNQLGEGDKKTLVEKGLVRNESLITLEEYLNDKSKMFADALAYRKESHTDVKENGFGFTPKTGTDVETPTEGGYGVNKDSKSNAKGPMIQDSPDAQARYLNRVAERISSKFKK